MNSESVQILRKEFSAEFGRQAGVQAFTQVGLEELAKISLQATRMTPENRIYIGPDAPDSPGARVHANWSKAEFDSALKPDGWLAIWISDAWITLMFARWEEYYRPAFARLWNVDKGQVKCPIMGDIRHLRNDVVHHSGVATKANTGKCKIITHIVEGQRIYLTPERLHAIHSYLNVFT